MLPSDILALVFLLFLFENKSDEQLLQLFIAIIDTQLLKTRRTTSLIDRESTDVSPPIVVKDFKTVDIENANDQ